MLGVALAEVAVQPLWEDLLAATAAGLVLGMATYMLRAARHLRTVINSSLEQAARKTRPGAALGVFSFVLLMITREGMETAFIVNALALKTQSMEMLTGAALGIGLAVLLAWAWTRNGQRVQLDPFFQVTSIFLLLFADRLMIYIFHELSEAGIPPLDNEYWHELTEPYGPACLYGQWLSVALVFAPVA